MAGVTPKDVDVFATYDSFSVHLLASLEGFGFCKEGEGGAFVACDRSESCDLFRDQRRDLGVKSHYAFVSQGVGATTVSPGVQRHQFCDLLQREAGRLGRADEA